MNDPIKDFIEKNRAEFDHLEAPTFDINKFKARAPQIKVEETPIVKLNQRSKWLAAASVTIAIAAFLFYNTKPEKAALASSNKQEVKANEQSNAAQIGEKAENSVLPATALQIAKQHTRRVGKVEVNTPIKPIYDQLTDSSSASNRLAAILEIKKKGTLSNYEIDKLAKSLNNDNNSNVRLAALDILKSYNKDRYVSSVLVSSLSTQTDPMVQLELVTLLGNMEHVKIEEKLYALASDPNTFGAVKDEAFSILLNQNKL
jgi:hypothetical protein